ncbi:5'-3' exonuclease [Nocardiopsis chromatogenes]|uniref:5'-3' exonuclease n=1 Tax=Nocardiopsis chromatogenes TaxID=280239 RepID=UPI00034A8B04|nr:5'-3' exonuclease H3TH domain-containing protein [Nocardiopsis chromatogenes]
MPAAPVLLVDGHHLLYRAAFGFPARITSRKGHDLTGTFGFLALLRKAHRTYAHDHQVVVAFDGEYGSAQRASADPNYKADRAEADHSPVAFLADIKRGLEEVGVAWTEIDTAEGDDVLATLTRQACEADRAVLVMSGDKDLYQLLAFPRTRLLNTASSAARRFVSAADVVDRHGVRPHQWPDYRALTGDPADSIPGIRGVGPATAGRLLAGGLALEDLPASGRLAGKSGERVGVHLADALAWRELIRLDHKVDGCQLPGSADPTPELPTAATVLERLRLW